MKHRHATPAVNPAADRDHIPGRAAPARATPAHPGAHVRAALALMLTDGIGTRTQLRLLSAFGSAVAACHASAADWAAAGVAPGRRARLNALDTARLERAVDTLLASGATLVDWCSLSYPPLLREIHVPPPFLFVRGDITACTQPAIAMVGARAASGYGRGVARRLARELAEVGYVIVSGLALGVDAAAHSGALEAEGQTIAVAACGPERVYPRRHTSLAAQIAGSGAVITEFPPGTAPAPGHFPQRNRVIAGLVRGVVVVEARARSGSLITARYALEQGREVFAVPGAVTNPLTEGCHALLRDGAALVTGADDVMAELGCPKPRARPAGGRMPEAAEGTQTALIDALGAAPLSTDALVAASALPAEVVLRELQRLQLQGFAARGADGLWSVTRDPIVVPVQRRIEGRLPHQ